jgi:hypothetical protein
MDVEHVMEEYGKLLILLEDEERIALIDALCAVDEEWSLRPVEKRVLARLQARHSRPPASVDRPAA